MAACSVMSCTQSRPVAAWVSPDSSVACARKEPSGESPSSHARRDEEIEAMENALSTLPDQVRGALLLRLELDLPYDVVASECGYPSSDAARMAIIRAMAGLAKKLSALGF